MIKLNLSSQQIWQQKGQNEKQKMNSLHKDQLKLSYQRYYDKSTQGLMNMNELNKANQILSKKNHERKSAKLLAHVIKDRKNSYEGQAGEYFNYEDFEQRIDSFLYLNDKEDQTGRQLIFELLDQDGDGLLNVQDLTKFLSSVGSTMEHKQVVELLELMTVEGTSLGRKQFQLIFQHF